MRVSGKSFLVCPSKGIQKNEINTRFVYIVASTLLVGDTQKFETEVPKKLTKDIAPANCECEEEVHRDPWWWPGRACPASVRARRGRA